jgi:hypothetical protein
MPIVDFGIVTALQEEFEYLEALMGPFEEVSDSAGTWYRTSQEAVNGERHELRGGSRLAGWHGTDAGTGPDGSAD